MASSIMHLAVTQELLRRQPFRNADRLAFGAILPDAEVDRAGHLTRFMWGLNKKTYDFERFRAEFGERMRTDDLYLGYYLHLVQDVCYRHFVYDQYQWDPLIPGNVEKLYQDYTVINRYVASRYHVNADIAVPDHLEDEAIGSIGMFDVDGMMAALTAYFQPVTDHDVFFFTRDMADEYVMQATEACLHELKALQTGVGLINSYDCAWLGRVYSLLETTLNTRDLGSYRVDGTNEFTRCGRLLRSDVARHPSERDVDYLQTAGITTIIDLRSADEKERKPHGLADVAGFDYRDLPIEEGSGVPESVEAIPDSYVKIAHSAPIRDVFKTIAHAESGVLFGCTAGKDRTGVVAALILWLCGVRKGDIVYDYMRTKENNRERFELIHQKYPEIDMNVVIPNENNMIGFMKKIEDAYGTVERYFAAIGVDEETQRKIKLHLLAENAV